MKTLIAVQLFTVLVIAALAGIGLAGLWELGPTRFKTQFRATVFFVVTGSVLGWQLSRLVRMLDLACARPGRFQHMIVWPSWRGRGHWRCWCGQCGASAFNVGDGVLALSTWWASRIPRCYVCAPAAPATYRWAADGAPILTCSSGGCISAANQRWNICRQLPHTITFWRQCRFIASNELHLAAARVAGEFWTGGYARSVRIERVEGRR